MNRTITVRQASSNTPMRRWCVEPKDLNGKVIVRQVRYFPNKDAAIVYACNLEGWITVE